MDRQVIIQKVTGNGSYPGGKTRDAANNMSILKADPSARSLWLSLSVLLSSSTDVLLSIIIGKRKANIQWKWKYNSGRAPSWILTIIKIKGALRFRGVNIRHCAKVRGEAKVTFTVLNLNFCNTHNSENIACFNYSLFTHKLEWKLHVACDLNFIVKGEGLLKLTGSHLHWKMVISRKRKFVTAGHWQEVILVYGPSNSSNCNDLQFPWRSFPYCKPFQVR